MTTTKAVLPNSVYSRRSRALRRPRFLRPAEVDLQTGYASKARSVLGWEPGLSFEQLIHRIVDADLVLQRR